MAMDRDTLTECGVCYDEGVEKFLGEKELYNELLVNFLTDNTFDEAKSCVENEDYEGVLRTIHAMKSVTGTLCMNKLYRKCCQVVDAVRAKEFACTRSAFDEAYGMYKTIFKAIEAGKE
ncbi:MAG: histidine kinase [Ruminococcus sp.]|nr:histidine kinase [Ruminococcus sp.]